MTFSNSIPGLTPTQNFAGLSTFVISLQEIPRNIKLISQLSDQGLDAKLIKAVDGNACPEIFDPKVFDSVLCTHLLGRTLSGPEIGCAMSHLICARQAYEADASVALVFEEDANVIESLASAISLIHKMPLDIPTIITLHSTTEPTFRKSTIRSVDTQKFLIAGRLFLPPATTVAYLMNKSAIKLFATRNKVSGVADWPPWSYLIDFWALYPWPVTDSGSKSSTIKHARDILNKTPKGQAGFAGVVIRYLNLFWPKRAWLHSRLLGGLRVYIRRLVVPYTLFLLSRLLLKYKLILKKLERMP